MVLTTVKLIKALIILACTVPMWRNRKQFGWMQTVALCCFLLFVAVLGNKAMSITPSLTESVIITAVCEEGDSSTGEEVCLTGFQIDGNAITAPGDPVEGKWFRGANDKLCWRTEADPRQPDGCTRTIVLNIPVGWVRNVVFSGGSAGGDAGVTYNGVTQRVSTISNGSDVTCEIGRSGPWLIIVNQVLRLAVFLLCTVVIFGGVLWIIIIINKEKRSGKPQWEKKRDYLLYALIAFAQFLFALRFSGVDGFWLDELFEIGWSMESNTVWERMFCGVAPPFLWNAFFDVWYHIAPYGEKYLLVPFEVATAIGIYFVGLLGRKWKNGQVGFIAALCAALSSTILYQCSYEIRSYPMYFMCGAMLLYVYLDRFSNHGAPSVKELILCSIATTFFASMHYHAIVFTIEFFIFDFILWRRKRISWKYIIPYLVAFVAYIPNIIQVLQLLSDPNVPWRNSGGWMPIPDLNGVRMLLSYYVDDSQLLLAVEVLGVSICLFNIYDHKHCEMDAYQSALPLLFPVFHITFFYLYGKFINPAATLWVQKYFLFLFIPTFLLCANAIDTVSGIVSRVCGRKHAGACVVFCFLVAFLPLQASKLMARANSIYEPYRQAADYIYADSDSIFLDDTLVLCSSEGEAFDAWNYYYIQRQGKRDALNAVAFRGISVEDLKEYNQVYTACIHPASLPAELEACLSTDYDLIS